MCVRKVYCGVQINTGIARRPERLSDVINMQIFAKMSLSLSRRCPLCERPLVRADTLKQLTYDIVEKGFAKCDCWLRIEFGRNLNWYRTRFKI